MTTLKQQPHLYLESAKQSKEFMDQVKAIRSSLLVKMKREHSKKPFSRASSSKRGGAKQGKRLWQLQALKMHPEFKAVVTPHPCPEMPAIVNVLSNILKLLFTSPSVQRLCPRNCNWPPVLVSSVTQVPSPILGSPVVGYPMSKCPGIPCGAWEYPTSKCPGIPEYLVPSWDALWWGYPTSKCPGIPKYLIPSRDPLWWDTPCLSVPGFPSTLSHPGIPLWWDTPRLSVPGFLSTLSHTGIPCGGIPHI